MKQEYAESVAARIIEQLEQGTAPWLKPWKPGELRMPYNPKTGSQYRGMNSLWLHMQGYADPRWMTYKQAASEEAQVKKGEKGTQIIYWKFTDEIKAVDEQGQPIIDPETGEQKKIVVKLDRPRSFSAVVFNAEQIDGLPPLEARPIQPEPERHSRAEAILAASGANIQHIEGDRAFYRPSTDSITLPLLSQFSSSDAYYATALHELGHWTGHESRLDRDLNHPFGSEGYAREELRAEIASFMLGERLDIGHDPGQHVAYIGSWVKTLKEDPREIFRAAADAEHIAGFVMGFEQEQFKDMDKPIIVAKPLNEPVNNPNISQARTYLNVPFAEKDEAKAAAKTAGFQLQWDKEAKSWYAPEGVNLEAVNKWRTDTKSKDETPKEEKLNHALPTQTMNKSNEIPQNVQRFLKELADAQDYEHAGYFILYQSGNEKVADLEQDEDIEKVGNQILEAIETGKGLELKENQFILDTVEKLKKEYPYEYGLYQPSGLEQSQNNDPQLDGQGYDPQLDGQGYDPQLDGQGYDPQLDGQGYDPQLDGQGYDPQFDGQGYDPQLDGQGYDPQLDGQGYDPQLDGQGYDPQLDGQGYDPQLDGQGYDPQLDGQGYDPQLDGQGYDPQLDGQGYDPQLARTYLNVPFAEKDEAKAAAKTAGFQLQWDKEAKSWYAPEGVNLEAVNKWRTDTKSKDETPKEGIDQNQKKSEVNAILANAKVGLTANKEQVTPIFRPKDDNSMTLYVDDVFINNLVIEIKMDKGTVYLEPNPTYDENGGLTGKYEILANDYDREDNYTTNEALNKHGLNFSIDFDQEFTQEETLEIFKSIANKTAIDLNKSTGPELIPNQTDKPNQQVNVPDDERFVMYHEPQPEAISPSRTYLAVPYAEKDEAKAVAKAAGFQLQWDKEAKSWYAPEGANLEAVSKWRTDNGNVLKNTEEKESVESQFARALKEAKLVVDSPVMDGKLHRVPTTTDKKGGLSGAYAGHLDGITAGGYIQNYHTGEVVHWKPEGTIKELTPEQRAEQTQQAQQQYEARQAERLAKHEATAEAAQILWKEAPLATPENQYCKAKGMLNPAASGLKVVPNTVSPEAHAKGIRIAKTAQEAKALRLQDPKNRVFKAGDLLVPCYDMEGKLWSLQSVNPYFKSLMKGGRKAGLLSVVGAENIQAAFDKSKSDPSFPLVLAGEGIATADTVSRLMRDRPVFLAIDSGNIDSVARQLREKNPTGLLLIAADNDHMKPRELDENGQPQKNVGLIKAKEAAENHGAGLMVPKFDHDEKGSDWNDLAANRGDKIAQRMLADEFIVAKRDAAIAADRMISLARSREAEARNDPTTSADDAYISSERDHAADMIAGASRHVSNINMAIADGKISTKGVNNRASVNASIQSKSTSMNERIKAERQSVTYEDAQKKGEEALKPKKTRSRGYDAGM